MDYHTQHSSKKLEQLIADYLPEKQYLRRTQLSGGKPEDGNGFTMWRRLFRDNKGEGQIVDYAGRKGMAVEEVEKWMGPYLGYDNMA